MRRIYPFLWLVALLVLAACAPAAPTTRPPEPTVAAVPTAGLPPTSGAPTFVPSTYRDEVNGFELDYPSDWTVHSAVQVGTRGSQAQLLSPGTTAAALAKGGSRLSITIHEWDPKGDLPAFIAQRQAAWDASGATVLDGPTTQLMDGRPASDFFVQAPDGVMAYFLFTTNGQWYLQLAGEGDLLLLEAIARTLRPLGDQQN